MSNKVETKLIGTTITSTATFKDTANTVVAPTTVNLKYKKPGELIITTVVVTATPITNLYTTRVLLDTAGTWNFRWESIDTNSVADEFDILVTDTKLK